MRFISFGFLLATTCVWVWTVCSLHSVTTVSRDRANVSLIIIIIIIITIMIIIIIVWEINENKPSDLYSSLLHLSRHRRPCCRRYFQHAHFIPIVGVGKRGEY